MEPLSCHCASDTMQLLPSGLHSSRRTHTEHVSACQWKEQSIMEKIQSINSYSLPSLQRNHQSASLCNNFHHVCHWSRVSRRGRSAPANCSASFAGYPHPEGANAPKTTQINVWKWYLLSSSPWPLAKSTVALSKSANRISTKLNMSKY